MMTRLDPFPDHPRARNRWVEQLRPPGNALDPFRPYSYLVEDERSADGQVVPVATVFLTNRECPWRCVMCDLWRNTLPEPVPIGAIPRQIEYALARLPSARQVKLYNSGSFFDLHAIPLADHATIARQLAGFDRVIVECHPGLVGDPCLRFRDMLNPELEVAMGLETAHPQALEKLNKRMTVDQFATAAWFLARHGIALRVFLLVHPPFVRPDEAMHWVERSIDVAFDCGAAVVSLIPTRTGNGAMEALAGQGHFTPAKLVDLEEAAAYGVRLGRGRVFADLWDIEALAPCKQCVTARADRLAQQNLTQIVALPVRCHACGA